MFNEEQTNAILTNFPEINMKCCNENIAKFHIDATKNYDFYSAIPEGKKYIIWFTSYNNKKACFLLTFSFKKLKIYKKIFVPFTNELINTVFKGTNFYIKGKQNSYITLEDVLFYKEKDVSRLTEIEKLTIFQDVFNNKNFTLPFINAYANYNNNTSSNNMIGLPLINRHLELLKKEIELLPYKVEFVVCKFFNENNEKSEKVKYNKQTDTEDTNNTNNTNNKEKESNESNVNIFDIINKVPNKKPPFYTESTVKNNDSRYNENNKQNNKQSMRQTTKQNNFNKEYVFLIKPNIQNDIYNLYTLTENKTEKFFDTAYIPNYTTSVMMNQLFRNIKENENLDKLEESDDEDEFENENIDKFVYLEKSYPMVCKYNFKFKKWYPVSLSKENAKIVDSKDLY